MAFQDHFSAQSSDYATYRPFYPPSLFEWLCSLVPSCRCVWDAGTGNGQVARVLASHTQWVLATDASGRQLAFAPSAKNIAYIRGLAERAPIAASTIDLITVGQALHWFDRTAFYSEVRRILRPGGVIAAWCYALLRVNAGCNAVLDNFHHDVLGPFWPKERVLVDSAYRELEFPFRTIRAPAFHMTTNWTLPQLLGYLQSWSAVQRFYTYHGKNAVDQIREELAALWGDPAETKAVTWPLHLLVGRCG